MIDLTETDEANRQELAPEITAAAAVPWDLAQTPEGLQDLDAYDWTRRYQSLALPESAESDPAASPQGQEAARLQGLISSYVAHRSEQGGQPFDHLEEAQSRLGAASLRDDQQREKARQDALHQLFSSQRDGTEGNPDLPPADPFAPPPGASLQAANMAAYQVRTGESPDPATWDLQRAAYGRQFLGLTGDPAEAEVFSANLQDLDQQQAQRKKREEISRSTSLDVLRGKPVAEIVGTYQDPGSLQVARDSAAQVYARYRPDELAFGRALVGWVRDLDPSDVPRDQINARAGQQAELERQYQAMPPDARQRALGAAAELSHGENFDLRAALADAFRQSGEITHVVFPPAHPPGPGRGELGQILESDLTAGGWLPGFTDAASTAKYKQLEKIDGHWVAPLIGAADGSNGLINAGERVVDSVLGRLGGQTWYMAEFLGDFQRKHDLSDDEMKAIWSDRISIYRKWDDGEKYRLLSDGTLQLNPALSDLLDTPTAVKLVRESGASNASQTAVLAHLPQIQATVATAKITSYAAAAEAVQQSARLSASSSPLKINPIPHLRSPEEWARETQREGDFGTPRFVLDYEHQVLDSAPWAVRKAWGLQGRELLGFNKIATTLLGLAGGAGSEKAGILAGEGAEAGNTIKAGLPSTGIIGDVVEEAPLIAFQILVTRGLGIGVGAVTTSANAVRVAGELGSFVTAGANTYGSTFAQEIAAGATPEEARKKATTAGLNTAWISAAFGAGKLGGIERAAAGKAAGMTVGQLLQIARSEGVKDLARSTEFRTFAREVLLSQGGQATQAGIDTLITSFQNADPGTDLSGAWQGALESAKTGGILGTLTHVLVPGEPAKTGEEEPQQRQPQTGPERVRAQGQAEPSTDAATGPPAVAAGSESGSAPPPLPSTLSADALRAAARQRQQSVDGSPRPLAGGDVWPPRASAFIPEGQDLTGTRSAHERNNQRNLERAAPQASPEDIRQAATAAADLQAQLTGVGRFIASDQTPALRSVLPEIERAASDHPIDEFTRRQAAKAADDGSNSTAAPSSAEALAAHVQDLTVEALKHDFPAIDWAAHFADQKAALGEYGSPPPLLLSIVDGLGEQALSNLTPESVKAILSDTESLRRYGLSEETIARIGELKETDPRAAVEAFQKAARDTPPEERQANAAEAVNRPSEEKPGPTTEEQASNSSEFFTHEDGRVTVKWSEKPGDQTTHESMAKAREAVARLENLKGIVRSPGAKGSDDAARVRFDKAFAKSGEFFSRMKREMGITIPEMADIWIAGNNPAKYLDGLRGLRDTLRGRELDRAAIAKFGKDTVGKLLSIGGLEPGKLSDWIRDVEQRSGRRFLPADFEQLPPGEKTGSLEKAMGEMTWRHATGNGLEIGQITDPLKNFFLNSKAIVESARQYQSFQELGSKAEMSRYKRTERAKKATAKILEQVEAVRTANPAATRLGKFDPMSPHARPPTLAERMTVRSKLEIGLGYDEHNELIGGKTDNELDKVNLLEFMKEGCTASHNHPTPDSPPSNADIQTTFDRPLCVQRITVPGRQGGITVFELMADPAAKIPNWRKGEAGEHLWKGLSSDLAKIHKDFLRHSNRSPEAFVAALLLIKARSQNTLIAKITHFK